MGRGVYKMPAEFHVVCSDSTYFSLEGFLELLFPKTDVLFRSEGKADMTIEVSEAVETEGAYSMEISRNGVSVVCGSYQGAVAAAATLAQMTDASVIAQLEQLHAVREAQKFAAEAARNNAR